MSCSCGLNCCYDFVCFDCVRRAIVLAGQQIAIQDPRSNFIIMAYDNAGRQKSIQNELGFITTTSFNAAGRPVTLINRNLQLKTLTYDNAVGVVSLLYSDGTLVTLPIDDGGSVTTVRDGIGIKSGVIDCSNLSRPVHGSSVATTLLWDGTDYLQGRR